MKKVPIGISDFKKLKSRDYYYVDKTMLIKDIFESGEAVLVTRPRRFGKTLNLSMLYYYLTLDDVSNNADLFVDTQIWKHKSYRNLQGQFPVIFITFKNISAPTYEKILIDLGSAIAIEFERFSYLLASNVLESHEIEKFNRIRKEKFTLGDLESSLEFLVRMLHKFHKKNIIVLLDEYDVPLQTAYIHGFYDELLPLIKELLTRIFKDQALLEKGVITGNLTLAKAGIFSGLNNLDVFNVTENEMADKFGFTTSEAYELLDYYKCKNMEEIKNWYDGYTFGEVEGIYNPWSMLKCIAKKGKRQMYWVNTNQDVFLKKLIGSADENIKSDLMQLLNGKAIQHAIRESVVFKDLDTQSDLIWSLLLFTGYLTYKSCDIKDGRKECNLIIPNQEITSLYRELTREIFTAGLSVNKAEELLYAMVNGDAKNFSTRLENFVLSNMSSFDIPNSEPERSYHNFVLGLVGMLDDYEVTSNRESGFGRCDIMLIPEIKGKPGIIIEFKVSDKTEMLPAVAQKALDQIVEKKYASILFSKKVPAVIAYGIAFKGKNLFVKSLTLSENQHK